MAAIPPASVSYTHLDVYKRQALGWFHPLVWLAVKKAEEDLELSCDEIVLKDADPSTRKKYAELLLSIAGDGRGYTTCLSASAKTLCYRLKSTVSAREKRLGLPLLFLTIIISSLLMGNVNLSTDRGKMTEVTVLTSACLLYTSRIHRLA